MANFSHLPNEIISEIWGNILEPRCIESFALVSKRVYAVARPFVEEHNKMKKEYLLFDLVPQTRAGAPVFLLKDVVLRPQIALYVTHLSINSYWRRWVDREDNDDSDGDDSAYDHPPYPEDIMALCIEAIGKTSFVPPEQVPRWIKKIRRGDEDPIRALLFLLLPNITTVTLVGDRINGKLLQETIERIAEAEQKMFLTRLITVNAVFDINDIESEGVDYECVKTFAALPLLQNLHVSRMGKVESERHIYFTLGSSNVTRMTLENSDADATFLFGLLESIKGLKTFIYVEPDEWLYRFDPFRIRAALLANAKHSLESLRILSPKTQRYKTQGYRTQRYKTQRYKVLGTFREFTALKELETTVCLLMKWAPTAKYDGFANLLPASIENLYLDARDSWNYINVPILVEEIVKAKLLLIPKLRVLKLRMEPENAILQGPENLIKTLEEKCREAGIELIVILT